MKDLGPFIFFIVLFVLAVAALALFLTRIFRDSLQRVQTPPTADPAVNGQYDGTAPRRGGISPRYVDNRPVIVNQPVVVNRPSSSKTGRFSAPGTRA